MKNPYSELINHMRTQGGKNNTPYVQIAIVIASDPLTVKHGDLQIGKANLLVADYLQPNYSRKIKLSESGNLGATDAATVGPYGTHTHNLTSADLETDLTLSESGLSEGDMVALIPTLDEQTYIILAKVVSP